MQKVSVSASIHGCLGSLNTFVGTVWVGVPAGVCVPGCVVLTLWVTLSG